ncbi:hypothetical protein CEUSTIGMA_g12137.t1 [Chlamydomonas eustigma]|uniref:Uncharacterized protein n=1 Tax=Chlamydomonas eustigma TaxID=1157962 RepID=A0A250XNP7_9CHLO|nr:hypothetical protein CEUSTIGMA_g12137.t1 [Chlamydomonas eustigma]|eukprot:GAX84715.1 hypothetical protein CEUSTIGMA_g12137.t1 [Chlamydomonas eustigma]
MLKKAGFQSKCRIAEVRKVQPLSCSRTQNNHNTFDAAQKLFLASSTALLASTPPALADSITNPFEGVQANSLYVTGGLVLMCIPGIWSQIKRAPQSSKKRKTYEVDGPARPGAMTIDNRARQIFQYFKKYNYTVKATGEVITFSGLYAADKGQAAAVTFYTFFSLGSVALVLSTLYPEVGNWWYLLTLLAPGAWFYYFSRGTREEEMKIKMVTSDDNQTIDILIEGDIEEITRFSKELQLMEKGMVYVKGILEQAQG